jgi:hypothetical protein
MEEVRARHKERQSKYEARQSVIATALTQITPYMGRLNEIFLYDYWEATEGLQYLVGVDSFGVKDGIEYVNTVGAERYTCPKDMDIVGAFRDRLADLQRVWKSGKHEERNPPYYYLNWALSKGFQISWLDFAVHEGLVLPTSQTEYPKLFSTVTELRPASADTAPSTKANESPLTLKQQNTYLNIIGAMLDLMLGKTDLGKPNSIYQNQAAIVSALVDKYGNNQGISESNLDRTFPLAKKNLQPKN